MEDHPFLIFSFIFFSHEKLKMNDPSVDTQNESTHQTLKIELDDGSIQEIEYDVPIDRYDLLRIIYHQLKYDRIYDWQLFYQSTLFIRKDNGIETSYPLNYSSNDLVYHLVLPEYSSSTYYIRILLKSIEKDFLFLL